MESDANLSAELAANSDPETAKLSDSVNSGTHESSSTTTTKQIMVTSESSLQVVSQTLKGFIDSCQNKRTIDQQTQIEIIQLLKSLNDIGFSLDEPQIRYAFQEIRQITAALDGRQLVDEEVGKRIDELIKFLRDEEFQHCKSFINTEEYEIDSINRFIKYVHERCHQLDEEVQFELAKQVVLLQRIEKLIYKQPRKGKLGQPSRNRHYKELISLVDFIEVGIKSLLQKKPNINLSKAIRIDVERLVFRYEHKVPGLGFIINRFNDARRSASIQVKVIYGLIAALLINGSLAVTITIALLVSFSIFNQTAKEISQIEDTLAKLRREEAQPGTTNTPPPTLSPSPSASPSPSPPATAVNPLTLFSAKNGLLGQQELQRSETRSIDQLEKQLERLESRQARERRKIDIITQVVWVVVAGTLGSVVSILIRIDTFQGKKYSDPVTPFFIGAVKPIIGASFAVFFYALISSELVIIPSVRSPEPSEKPISTPSGEVIIRASESGTNNKEMFFIFAVAFLVGFSERLAKDTITKMEETFGAEPPQPPPAPRLMTTTANTNTVEVKTSTQSNTSGTSSSNSNTPQLEAETPPREPENRNSNTNDD